MATYREIKGIKVPYLDADPPSAVADTEEGSVWYNSATGNLKAFVSYDTWATTAPLNTARRGTAGCGTQTAAVIASGYSPPLVGVCEEYNGSGWSESGDLNTDRAKSGMSGIQTSALFYSGRTASILDNVESYNGATWSEVADVNTARYGGGSAGVSSTSALYFGGDTTADPSTVDSCESWDGSSWTEVADLVSDSGRIMIRGCGTATAALGVGGDSAGAPTTAVVSVEEWN